LQRDAAGDNAYRRMAAILADQPGEAEECGESRKAVQYVHHDTIIADPFGAGLSRIGPLSADYLAH
jgi:hypothetical protein